MISPNRFAGVDQHTAKEFINGIPCIELQEQVVNRRVLVVLPSDPAKYALRRVSEGGYSLIIIKNWEHFTIWSLHGDYGSTRIYRGTARAGAGAVNRPGLATGIVVSELGSEACRCLSQYRRGTCTGSACAQCIVVAAGSVGGGVGGSAAGSFTVGALTGGSQTGRAIRGLVGRWIGQHLGSDPTPPISCWIGSCLAQVVRKLCITRID